MIPFLFVLAMVIFTKDGPLLQMAKFDDQFACEVEEGRVVTEANKDPAVDGWVWVGEPCGLIAAAKKA